MFDRLRPSSRPWTLIAAIALVAFNAACTSPAAPPAAVVPVAASGAAAPLPGMHAPELATGWTDKPGWTAQRYMIAAANPLATQAGYEMLKAGGTAVDAAIATQMVLALVEPQSSGIGGGAFMLYFDGKTTQAYDGRETAPAAATDRLFYGPTGQPMSFYEGVVGGRSVGTPGVLRMLEAAHRANGKLPWRRLFQPAIRLAEHGFTISPRLATLIANDRYLAKDPAARAYFYNKDGTPKAAGTVLKNPALAAVLRQVADRGANAFYTGAIARDIVAKVRKHPTNPGLLSMQDLARYKAKVRAPLCVDYRRSIVCGMPPPSSGGLAIAQMLGILEAMPDWQQIGAQKPVRNEVGYEPTPFAAHVFSEAGRLAYADRARYVADPDFVPLPGGNWASLIDKSYLAQRAQLIGDNSMGVAQAGTPQGATLAMADDRSPELPSTSDIAIVDRYGHALSMTTSIEDAFGSRLMVRGFLLNNQLTDFSFVSTENGRPVANRVQPGKRPRSAMSPELVFDKKTKQVTLIVGSAGGPAIINHVAKALVGVLDWGMTMQQAIALPNFGSMNGPTQLERGRVSDALVDGLKGRGHDVQIVQMNSGLQGIQRLNVQGQTVWFGGADPRREGVAMGE
ncbi:gamma-glutamyltransferase [Burkholderia multivorans]|uniref:gamma-glutamyltransferase n=1 Tax=Burkholderia multivorans TaxID=87883 RepID=UPI000D00164A|nr:gamma-glutamyltransferase [Burkholderia multivorans]MBY4794070.1 gamma-glutamyltransferase [Burkholderia multivorans]PRE56825.1 gamma-glutamyltransferase [Burkholderia multivorans]PRE85243.1 gamma-glutamyltransferase [Burkholderia multivorans]PRG28475.1 gamma-glutamyltransferase [Burkholderia multivorans]PRH27854.1 gamma-glutamyltransferase [Burkholderia multivorans]